MKKFNDISASNNDVIDGGVQRIEIDLSRFDKQPDPEAIKILPTRNLVLFPDLTISFELGRRIESCPCSSCQFGERAYRYRMPDKSR